MKRLFVLMLFALLALPVHAQYGITMHGGLRDSIGHIIGSAPIAVSTNGLLRVDPDATAYYTNTITLTGAATNQVLGSPIALFTLTNTVDTAGTNGGRIPEIVYFVAKVYDGHAIPFTAEFFRQDTTNTYTAGTAITNWGTDGPNLLAGLSHTYLTNTWGFNWRTNANIAMLTANPFSFPVPIQGTNIQVLLKAEGAFTVTNNIEVIWGVKR